MPWPKGKPFSEETKQKLRERRQTRQAPTHTPEGDAKIAQALRTSERARQARQALADSRRGKPQKFADPVARSLALSEAMRGKKRNVKRTVKFHTAPAPIQLDLPEFPGCMPASGSEVAGVMGVYAIIHTASGRVYVGSALDVETRWFGHRFELARQQHHSIYLQRAWKKYGPKAFTWRLLERVESVADLLPTEQKWIDHLQACDRKHGFNMAPTAGNSHGFRHSQESIEKMRAAHRGHTHTEATKAQMRASNLRKGAKLTVEDVRAIRERFGQGHNDTEIAQSYGVTRETIANIRAGKTWANIS